MAAKLVPMKSWRAAVCESALEATTRHVALALSLYVNERGESVHPGAARLSRDTALSERTVRAHLATLVDTGWLLLERSGGLKGQLRHANVYVFATPARVAPVNPGTSCTREPAAPVNDDALTPADEREPLQEIHPVVKREFSLKRKQRTKTPAAKHEPSGPKTPEHVLAEKHWNAAKPKPTLAGGFVALRGMCRTLLEAEWPEDQILAALNETRSYTLNAITFALRSQAGTKPRAGPRAPVSQDRNDSTRTVAL